MRDQFARARGLHRRAGGVSIPANAIRQRDGAVIRDRAGATIQTRS